MILFNIHLATRGYVSDLGLDILGNYYLHGKILFTSVLATRGHVSGLGLDIYIYIYPCTGGNYYLHGKLSFTIVLVSIHIHIQVQEEMITYMENDHLPCLGLGIYTHISMYKRKLLSSWEMIIFHLNGLGLDEYVSPCKGGNYDLHEKLSLTILGK